MARGKSSFVLDVDGVQIEVTRKNVKNVNCRVSTDGQARMSVPLTMSSHEIRNMALRHLDWFRRSQRTVAQRQPVSPLGWETGDSLRVWGEERKLLVRREENAPRRGSCELRTGQLVVHVPREFDAQRIERVVERWLSEQLRRRVEELLPSCEARVGRSATQVTLRRMKTRWGSCTSRTGRIRLNIALAECPPDCTEMVLIHELCHLVEPNHGTRFHALMDLHCPSWRASQRWLDEHRGCNIRHLTNRTGSLRIRPIPYVERCRPTATAYAHAPMSTCAYMVK